MMSRDPDRTTALRMERNGAATVVTLCRPAVRNAIDATMVSELHGVCDQLEAEPGVVVITGEGSAFAAGADIGELRYRGRDDALRGINSGLFERIARLPMPTVAALNGPAIGGGAELAYACDFRVASTRASIGNPEVMLGIMPAAGACWRLRELVGIALARQMLLAGHVLDADGALAAGLVSAVVEPEMLLEAATELTTRLARAVPLALRLTKLALAAPEGAHPRFDDVAQAVLFETTEKQERMTAFLDRQQSRQP